MYFLLHYKVFYSIKGLYAVVLPDTYKLNMVHWYLR